ncbi:MAG: VWA domain-containing protein [Pseudomonadales bacterium]|nr:VWA domain-containing protein [Pseudomonadales bacterium]MCP5184819.1 VWA domain-containing protein [Pseudomonadales bacterium]
MARRRDNVMSSLAFLDVMSCGFGAVVLIFLILNHTAQEDGKLVNQDMLAELRMLDYEVQRGEEELAQLVTRMDVTQRRIDETDRKIKADREQLTKQNQSLETAKETSEAREDSLAKLQTDIDAMQKEVKRRQAAEVSNDGGRILQIQGQGNRQYLTGMRIGGRNILIAVDVSASMLDASIVNVLRRRAQSDAAKRQAPKWTRALRTVDWLAAQLPLDSSFQLVTFNNVVTPLAGATSGTLEWTPVGDGRAVRDSLEKLRMVVPNEGNSLEKLFLAIRNMVPMPDNVYLITDSLPTQGTSSPRNALIAGKDRLELFADARRQLPNNIPVNVILFPMEGDPFAAGAFWNLARTSGGSFLAPSRDWP